MFLVYAVCPSFYIAHLLVPPTDCTEEDPGDHSAGQAAGTEAPAGRRRVTASLQVTSEAAPVGTSQ